MRLMKYQYHVYRAILQSLAILGFPLGPEVLQQALEVVYEPGSLSSGGTCERDAHHLWSQLYFRALAAHSP